MRKIIIEGREYPVRFDMGVMEQIEDEFGGIQKVFGNESDAGAQMRKMMKVFVWMVNAAYQRLGNSTRITADDMKFVSMATFGQISIAIRMAFTDSMKMQADIDVKDHRDGYLQELQKKTVTEECHQDEFTPMD